MRLIVVLYQVPGRLPHAKPDWNCSNPVAFRADSTPAMLGNARLRVLSAELERLSPVGTRARPVCQTELRVTAVEVGHRPVVISIGCQGNDLVVVVYGTLMITVVV